MKKIFALILLSLSFIFTYFLYSSFIKKNVVEEKEVSVEVSSYRREIQFCENEFNFKSIKIEGVDVIERIANLAKQNIKSKDFPEYPGTGHICDYLKTTQFTKASLEINYNQSIIEGGQKVYRINIENLEFIVNPETDYIFEKIKSTESNDPGNFGALVPIGRLK